MKRIFSILFALVLVVSFSLVTAVPAMAATEVWVDDDFTGATPGWGTTHFDKIQDGIDAVDPGGTVNVAAGTYREIVLIDKSVTLLGEDKDNTIITDEGAGYSGITNYATIGIGADDVKVSGFTVRATADPAAGASRTIHVSSWFNGHYPGEGYSAVPSNIEISDNNIYYPSTGKKTGIIMCRTEDVTITGNTIVGEESGAGKGIGIYIDYQEYGGNRDNYGSSYIIENNIISGGSIGMSLGCIKNFTISGNTVSGMSGDLAGGDTGHGAIEVWYAYNAQITGNTVSNNYNGIAVWNDIGGDENVQVHFNNIEGNTNLGLIGSEASQEVDATNNWWGSPTGPLRQLPNEKWVGKGDRVSGNVDYIPWLPRPIDFWHHLPRGR